LCTCHSSAWSICVIPQASAQKPPPLRHSRPLIQKNQRQEEPKCKHQKLYSWSLGEILSCVIL
jgi:hypothetical protein